LEYLIASTYLELEPLKVPVVASLAPAKVGFDVPIITPDTDGFKTGI
jgi:hypothetical protein